jgi:hypothetical protein
MAGAIPTEWRRDWRTRRGAKGERLTGKPSHVSIQLQLCAAHPWRLFRTDGVAATDQRRGFSNWLKVFPVSLEGEFL